MGVRLWPSSRTTAISAAEGLESVVEGGEDHQQHKRSSRGLVATALPLLLFTLLASLRKRCSRLLAVSRRRKEEVTAQLNAQSTEQPIVAEGGPARERVVVLKMANVIDLCSDGEDGVLRSPPSAPQHGKQKLRLPTARVADTRVATASSSSWACLACTYQNDTQHILCQMCDAERKWGDTPSPARAATSSRAAGSWACEACTLVNDATSTRCEACTSLRPQQPGVAASSSMRNDKPATVPMLHPLKSSDKPCPTAALTCQLCGSKQSASELYALDRCSHRACRDCLQQRVHAQVAERLSNAQQPQQPRDATLPTCSVADCGQPLSERDTRMLLKAQELADLNAFTRRAVERLWGRDASHTCASCGKKGTAVHPERVNGAASSKRRTKLLAAEVEGDRTHAEQLANVTFKIAPVVAGVTPALAAGPQPIPAYKRSHLEAMRVGDLRALVASKGLDSNRVKAELVKDLLTASSCLSRVAPAAAATETQRHQLSVPPPWLVCTACVALQCKACGERMPNANHCADHLLACEQRGPYVALQVVSAIDAAMRGGNAPTPRASAAKKATQLARGHWGTSGSSKWARGTGYGGNHYEAEDEASLDGARWRQQTTDAQLQSAAAALTQVLSEASSDDGVAGTASPSRMLCVVMQTGGHVAGLLRTLLCNDSMLDVGDRRSLYLQMLALLRAIGGHAELLPILCERQRADDANAGGNGTGEKEEKEDEDEGPASVVDVLKGLHVQSQVFLKAQGARDLELDEVGIAAMGVALDVRTSFEQVKASVDVWKATSKSLHQPDGAIELTDGPKAVDNAAARAKAYMDEIRELQFDMVSLLENGHYAHYFRKEIEGSKSHASSGNAAGRALRVMQEISSLATSLPLSWNSSVFLRADERRQDVLKAAIIGPEGTPYANGVFVFDVFLPPQYPEVPPKVQLLTTGGGLVRFNPNLYASGKVCLSLLGTWSGPGWRPGQSTLLQVLVSIQSLIFVEQPYFNEPGWEPQLGTPTGAAASECYNSEQRVNTLAVAILPTLVTPPAHFRDALAAHFRHKRAAIEAQCNAWCQELQQQRPDLPATVASIKQHLAKYA